MTTQLLELPLHVINLKRRPDRLKSFMERFDGRLKYKVFEAVDAQSFPEGFRIKRPHESDKEYRANTNAIGCSLSHVKLLSSLLQSEEEVFLVGEDDMHLQDVTFLQALLYEFKHQHTCNLVNFGFVEYIRPQEHEHVSHHLRRSTGKSICTHLYAIKRSIIPDVIEAITFGIEQLRKGGDRRQFAVDVMWVQGRGVVHCIPPTQIAVQSGGGSDIEV